MSSTKKISNYENAVGKRKYYFPRYETHSYILFITAVETQNIAEVTGSEISFILKTLQLKLKLVPCDKPVIVLKNFANVS